MEEAEQKIQENMCLNFLVTVGGLVWYQLLPCGQEWNNLLHVYPLYKSVIYYLAPL